MVQVIKNPITVHLPTGCRKLGTSFSSDKLVDMEDYASDEPVVVVIGAMAHGKVCGGMCIGVLLEVIRGVHISQFIIAATILPLLTMQVEVDYTEEEVAISEYPLSAALTCTKVCCAFERAWGIK